MIEKNVYVVVWKDKATGEYSFDYAMDRDRSSIEIFMNLRKAKDRMWELEGDLSKLLVKHPDFVEDGSYVVRSARLSVR